MSKTCLSLQVPSVGEVVLSCPDAGAWRFRFDAEPGEADVVHVTLDSSDEALNEVENFMKQVGEGYQKRIGYPASFYVVEIGGGPCRLD